MAREDHETSRRLYQGSTAWLIAITWPIYLVFIGSGGLLLQVFGHKYGGGSTVLVILCSSMLIATGCGMVDIVLLMGGRSSWNLFNVLLAFTTNITLDLILILATASWAPPSAGRRPSCSPTSCRCRRWRSRCTCTRSAAAPARPCCSVCCASAWCRGRPA